MNLKFLNNTPISRRLLVTFAIAAIIPGIIITLLGTSYLDTLNSRGQAILLSNAATSSATTQLSDLQQMNSDIGSYAQLESTIRGDPSMAPMTQELDTTITNLQSDFNQKLAAFQQSYEIATSSNMAGVQSILLGTDPNNALALDQKRTLSQLAQGWSTYSQDLSHQALLITSMTEPAANLKTINSEISQGATVLAKIYTPLQANMQGLVTNANSVGDQVAQLGSSQTTPVAITTFIAILISAVAVLTIGYIVSLTITNPLTQLTTLTRRIAKGETNARAIINGRNEINIVATSMNKMLDNIVDLIQQTQSQRDFLQSQVEKLVSEVSGVGEGDLRIQAEVTADALGVLADSFNYMVEELGSLVVRVKSVAQEVENSTEAIFERLTRLVETGDIQLAQIGGATVEVEHLADSSRQVAGRTQNLFNVAYTARANAEGGREAVQQAVQGMERIHENVQTTATKVQTLGERSREINNIVEAISGIAHQTNRLALDAAIQAAMAGENGKGFGAVAADIRRLAERAKDQTSSIARIVRSVREDIGAAAVSMQDTERETSAGSKLTQEAGAALESLFVVVEQQAKEIEHINQAATQQLESSNAIVQTMHSISATTQQSTMSTREASHNMERLARLVEQLRSSVEAFKLRENQDYIGLTSNVNMFPDNQQENPLSISGTFRTVSSTALPAGMGSNMRNALPAPMGDSADPFAYYPLTPYQQQYGEWEPSTPTEQPWFAEPFQAYNERSGNGNGGNGNGNRGW